MTDKIPQLSKSRFSAGLQCHKRLYLECFHNDQKDPLSSSREALFESGHIVGELARKKFPRGVLIAEDHLDHEQAVASTQTALTGGYKILYEAAFTFDDIKIRVDILQKRDDGTFNLIEVKSSTSVKEEHTPDLAIQLYVLNGDGLKMGQSCLLHINSDYVYAGGDYDLDKLFTLEDISKKILEYQKDVPLLLKNMRQDLYKKEIPDIAVGPHCTKPYDCPFYDYCHHNLPTDHITLLPNSSEKIFNQLKQQGIEQITKIPEGFEGLKEVHWRVRNVLLSGKPYFNERIASELAKLKEPIFFIDFETINPALPFYVGTKPYQQVPFQWSAHIMNGNGILTHHEFLADGVVDPRREFANTLIEVLKTDGPILVYSSFEKTCLKGLAEVFPELKNDLEKIWLRFFDLYSFIRGNTYHADYNGSFSIKSVLPALVPSMSYKGLAISEGGGASTAFVKLLTQKISQEEKEKMRRDLLAYCKQDTLAMVEIFKKLKNE